MSLALITFDFDGVLVNSEQLMRRAFAHSFREVVGIGVPPTDAYLERMGMSLREIFRSLDLPEEMSATYRAYSHEHSHLVTLFDGAVDCLSALQSAGFLLALLTGKDRARTMDLIEQFSLAHYFSCVITSCDVSCGKPNPEGMNTILNRLHIDPVAAIMVGDSVQDIVCAQRAGVRAVGATWGTRPDRLLTNSSPEHTVRNFDELRELIRSL